MTSESLALGVIPARADSSRFPRKVIALIHQKPMLQYIWEAAKRSALLSEVIIATDDDAIAEIARGFGAKVAITPRDLASGTDRVALVAKDSRAGIIVNLQADEPLLSTETIDRLIAGLRENRDVEMATLAVQKESPEDLNNPNIVKVVLSGQGKALYFSRHPINYGNGLYYKHIGIYAYRMEALQRFCRLPPSALERAERLEQLRALENGFQIQIIIVEKDTIAVDTPADLAKVEHYLNSKLSNEREIL